MASLPDDLADAFEYLDDLRESGVTNMYGAGSYLVDAYGYDHPTSRAVLSAWMATFDIETPPSERAAKASA